MLESFNSGAEQIWPQLSPRGSRLAILLYKPSRQAPTPKQP